MSFSILYKVFLGSSACLCWLWASLSDEGKRRKPMFLYSCSQLVKKSMCCNDYPLSILCFLVSWPGLALLRISFVAQPSCTWSYVGQFCCFVFKDDAGGRRPRLRNSLNILFPFIPHIPHDQLSPVQEYNNFQGEFILSKIYFI